MGLFSRFPKFRHYALEVSEEFYRPIQIQLLCALRYYNAEAVCYFDYLFANVVDFNRCYVQLMKMGEYKAALPLIRMQVDNLIYAYAETCYPNRILEKVFTKGKSLNDIKIANKNLKPSDLLSELSERYEPKTSNFRKIKDIYNTYCCFIHPSKEQFADDIIRKVTKKVQKERIAFKGDMEEVNFVFVQMLSDYYLKLLEGIRADGKKNEYKAYLRKALAEAGITIINNRYENNKGKSEGLS